MPFLSEKPCPRCGCYIRGHFKCNCGCVEKDFCQNCGRWTDLANDAFIELAPSDAICSQGKTAHLHSEEEKSQRTKEWFERIKKARTNANRGGEPMPIPKPVYKQLLRRLRQEIDEQECGEFIAIDKGLVVGMQFKGPDGNPRPIHKDALDEAWPSLMKDLGLVEDPISKE